NRLVVNPLRRQLSRGGSGRWRRRAARPCPFASLSTWPHYSILLLAPKEVGGAPMQMNQIRYFLAVCETLNFTRAAEKCNVSQPALTRGIHKLEEELGGLLLRREHNL